MKKPKYIPTKIKLAKTLEISRTTLDEYLTMPGAPRHVERRGWLLADVANFIANCAATESTLAGADETYRSLKMDELRQRCRRLKVKADLETGVVIEKAKVVAVIHEIFEPMRSELRQLLENEMPSKLEGLDAAAIRGEMRRAFDLIMAAWSRFADYWPE